MLSHIHNTKKSLISDNRAVFGLNSVNSFFTIILGIALFAYVIIIITGTLSQNTNNIVASSTSSSNSSLNLGSYFSTTTTGIQSETVSVYNNSWLNFNGGDDQVSIPSKESYYLNTTNRLTVSFWYYVPSHDFTGNNPTSNYNNFVNKYDYEPTRAEWHFRIENNTGLDGTDLRPCRISFYVFNTTGGLGSGAAYQDNTTYSSCPNEDGKWIYTAGKFNGTDVFIYKNGILRNSAQISDYGITVNGTNASITLGANPQGAGFGEYKGSLDNFRIYNVSLTNEEVAELYYSSVTEKTNSTPIYNDTYLTFYDSSYVDTNFTTKQFGNETTFSGWFNRPSNATNDVIWGGSNAMSIMLRLDSANSGFRWHSNSSAGGAVWTNNYSLNTWNHFALVYNNTNGNTTLWLNGVNKGGVVLASRYNPNDLTNVLTLGKRAGTPDYFNGSLDELIIYNKSLDSTEIASIYAAGRVDNGAVTDSRLLYYNFNNDKFVSVYDNQTSSYTGSILGTNNLCSGCVVFTPITHNNDGIIIGYRTFSITNSNIVGQWNLNEGMETTIYDISKGNNGTISGATYGNDGVFIGLTKNLDYIINDVTGILTVTNNAYLYYLVTYSWIADTLGNYNANQILIYTSNGITSFFGNINPVYAILAILVIILVLVVLVRVVQNPTGASPSL